MGVMCLSAIVHNNGNEAILWSIWTPNKPLLRFHPAYVMLLPHTFKLLTQTTINMLLK